MHYHTCLFFSSLFLFGNDTNSTWCKDKLSRCNLIKVKITRKETGQKVTLQKRRKELQVTVNKGLMSKIACMQSGSKKANLPDLITAKRPEQTDTFPNTGSTWQTGMLKVLNSYLWGSTNKSRSCHLALDRRAVSRER